MGDDDDFVIESTDAGATATIPMEAGQVKKGGEPRKFSLLFLHDCHLTATFNSSSKCTVRMPSRNTIVADDSLMFRLSLQDS
jgi:hypothetical protein